MLWFQIKTGWLMKGETEQNWAGNCTLSTPHTLKHIWVLWIVQSLTFGIVTEPWLWTCFNRFLVRGRVETHKRNVHSIGTADQQLCSYCGRTFGSGYNMKNHLAREHGIGHLEAVCVDIRNSLKLYTLEKEVKGNTGVMSWACSQTVSRMPLQWNWGSPCCWLAV